MTDDAVPVAALKEDVQMMEAMSVQLDRVAVKLSLDRARALLAEIERLRAGLAVIATDPGKPDPKCETCQKIDAAHWPHPVPRRKLICSTHRPDRAAMIARRTLDGP